MKRIDVYFLVLATLLLLAGAGLGIQMGASEDFTMTPVHAHLNLVGWASLAIFGLVYRAYPQLAKRRLAFYHLVVSATSAVLLPIGIGLAVLRNQPLVAIAASVLWVLGALIFLVQLISLLRRSGDEPRIADA